MLRSLFASFLFVALAAAERPNILWLTSEDNAAHWLGCYGNEQAETPHLDAFAARSIKFDRAYSNAPVCAVARATILMGLSSPAMGTQHMRSRHPIPADLIPYVTHLRNAGYYCTNRSKTDYNFRGDDKSLWDESSPRAHYRDRPDGAPFFAVMNFTVSHESSLFPRVVAKNRERGIIPETPRLRPASIELPPYVPDLPEMRSDFAIYHDVITALDRQIGQALTQLENEGLADDTIVFYYSDHGGATPRGKRYLYDTGVRVPMLVHVPEKWKHLSPFANGASTDEVVSFVDLAPTLLSLTGIAPDPNHEGRAFLGPRRQLPGEDNYAFLYADRFDEIYGMRRGWTDGRYKYIRRFTPRTAAAPYSFYQFEQPSWTAWHQAWKSGKLTGIHAQLWENAQPQEALYDLRKDPWELHNLAEDPKEAERLRQMRETLYTHMLRIRDTGIVPEPLFDQVRGEMSLRESVQSPDFPYQELLELAFAPTTPASEKLFVNTLLSTDPVARYWALTGLASLGKNSAAAELNLISAFMCDPFAINSAQAAVALHSIGKREMALTLLKTKLAHELSVEEEAAVINTFIQLRSVDEIPEEWFKKWKGKDTGQLRLSVLAAKAKLLR